MDSRCVVLCGLLFTPTPPPLPRAAFYICAFQTASLICRMAEIFRLFLYQHSAGALAGIYRAQMLDGVSQNRMHGMRE